MAPPMPDSLHTHAAAHAHAATHAPHPRCHTRSKPTLHTHAATHAAAHAAHPRCRSRREEALPDLRLLARGLVASQPLSTQPLLSNGHVTVM